MDGSNQTKPPFKDSTGKTPKSVLQHFIFRFRHPVVVDLASYSVYAVLTSTEKLDSKVIVNTHYFSTTPSSHCPVFPFCVSTTTAVKLKPNGLYVYAIWLIKPCLILILGLISILAAAFRF